MPTNPHRSGPIPVPDPQPAPDPAPQPKPGLTRREIQRRETRERLYQAARAEFRSEGYQDAQIDRIAAAAGVARGTFYFHFPTKEHVLLEFQRRTEGRIVDRLQKLPRASSLRAYLDGAIDAMLAEQSEVDQDLQRHILAMYVRQPLRVVPAALPLLTAMSDFFADAAERGEVRSDLEPEEAVGLFLGSLFGILASGSAEEEKRPALSKLIEIFVRGIRP
jgi:AcrR family transcriptional regulator